MNEQEGLIANQSFQSDYDNKCTEWRSEPVENRKCNDIPCLVIFFILLGVFLAVGSLYISKYNGLPFDPSAQDLFISQYKGQLATCMSITLVLSLLYIILIRMMPKIMVYLLIGLSLALLAGFGIAGIILGQMGLAIPFLILFLIYGLILFCCRKSIETGIVLIKVATRFMTQKWGVFVTPIIKVVLSVLLAIFWIYSLSCILVVSQNKSDKGEDPTGQNVLAVVWVFFWLLFNFFFYYMMVYTIAVACSFWYYNVTDKNYFTTAYNWLFKYSLGSIVFASILIAVITFARMIVETKRKNQKNLAVVICLCLVSCCLRRMEALLRILNHNTVIVMAVTGQSFIEGAKTTIGILSRFLALLNVTNVITSLLNFWGIIIISGISGIISYSWLKNDLQNGDLALIVITSILASILISTLVLSVLVESVSSVFIFYCFDTRFRELGYNSNNMPQQINESLGFIISKDPQE